MSAEGKKNHMDPKANHPKNLPHSGRSYRYAIRVERHLDILWSEWLGGMTITYEEGGVTRLEGPLIDQAALHGLLNKLRLLRLPILWVQRLGARDGAVSRPGEPRERAA